MSDMTVGDRDRAELSRREFAIFIAAGAACTALPAQVQASETTGPRLARSQTNASARSAEADAQYQVLIGKYGARLSDEQKADIKRLIDQGQKSAMSLRSFRLGNADEPANVFRAALRS